jgi:N-acetylmuramoyl-L-alanine amidase
LGKSLRQAGFSPSQHHAEAIEGENKPWADQINGVFYYDNLVVLKATVMPAVLLEAAVIANRQDEDNITKPQVRQQMAIAVAQGLSACGVLPSSP